MGNKIICLNKRSPYLNTMSERLVSIGVEKNEIERVLNLLEYVEALSGC